MAGVGTMETGQCEICLRTLTEKRWQFFHCPICNHGTAVSTYDEIVDTYHSEEYARHLVASNGSFAEVKRQWTTNVGILKRHCPVGSKALEVGCLDGSGVSSLIDAGFDAYGFDVAESSRSECVRNGIDKNRIHIADSLLDVEFGQRFNLITIREVIEHVPDVFGLLLRAYELLEPNGLLPAVLMVQTPRFSEVREEWRCPQHLRVYSTQSLVHILRLAGFEVLEKKEWDGGVCLLCRRVETMFLSPDPYSTHQRLLVRGLMETTGPVLELGCGYYSTPIVQEICRSMNRELTSLDNHPAWVKQFDAKTVRWDQFNPIGSYGLTLVDHADQPQHQRWKQIFKLLPWCDTFVVHDAEDPLYGYGELRNMFNITQDSTSSPSTELWSRKHPSSVTKQPAAIVVISTYSETDSDQERDDLCEAVKSCRATSNCEIIVVDDGSCQSYREWLKTVDGVELIQGKVNRGIAWSKNVALSIFESRPDVDVIFLVDDDVVFESQHWQQSYSSKLRHLPLLAFSPPQLRTDAVLVGDMLKDSLSWGCFIAISRKCYEIVGLYSTEFPAAYGWEHIEYYYRAAIAGLVPAVGFYDIAGSERLLRLNHGDPSTEAMDKKQRMIEANHKSEVWIKTEAAYKALNGAGR